MEFTFCYWLKSAFVLHSFVQLLHSPLEEPPWRNRGRVPASANLMIKHDCKSIEYSYK